MNKILIFRWIRDISFNVMNCIQFYMMVGERYLNCFKEELKIQNRQMHLTSHPPLLLSIFLIHLSWLRAFLHPFYRI